jgi:hydrogenase maturation protease
MNEAMDNLIVVIGYGSSLRGDDAIGRRVVESISEMRLSNVKCISVTQLVPELAAQVAEAKAVIFVDACLPDDVGAVVVHEVTSASHFHGVSHEAAPRELLSLTAMCYGKLPPAWLIAVPATDFELTDRLSAAAHKTVCRAIVAVEQLIGQIDRMEVAHA